MILRKIRSAQREI